MKRIFVSALPIFFAVISAFAWAPKGDKIKTVWGENVTPKNVWQSYPRPQLKRKEWQNLNGMWQYTVTSLTTEKGLVKYNEKILVPFAIESALSGVAKTFTPDDKLWYRKEFTLNSNIKGKQTWLHFGAVDYECQLWVNNKFVGKHIGGNNSFSFDITNYLKQNGTQIIELSVVDPTDKESVTRGKQQLNQTGIWYTPVSGIWQTVWLETVNKTHISSILPQSDLKKEIVNLQLNIANARGDEQLSINVTDNGKTIATLHQKASKNVEIKIQNPVLWTPETPKLYKLEAELCKNNKVLDHVESYFAMRDISIQHDKKGYNRICLNGNPIFQYGTLDQGWWPDGLLTPPSPTAMRWDIEQLKSMGFNTIRKHIKVEPAIYYYYADSLGMMVWQDMPSGFATSRKDTEFISPTSASDWKAPKETADERRKELNEMIESLRFFPSITTWVLFNEGWGQHNTTEIVNMVKQKDSSRIINGVSGWTERYVGDLYDIHNYPSTSMIFPSVNGNRISVLGEFGGLGLPIKEHLWNPNIRNWGYKNIEGGVDLVSDYAHLVKDLETLIAQGLSAAIYTQTTDVEGEVNGLITYDRKVTKIPATLLHLLHSQLYKTIPAKASILIADAQEGKKQSREITINGIKQNVIAPFEIKGEAKVSSTQKFNIDEIPENLSLWLNVNGPTKIWVNGMVVFDQQVRYTTHYNQYNLSDFSSLLKKGENTFKIEVSQKENKMNFDYGLLAF